MLGDNNSKISYKKKVLFVGIPDMAYVCFDGLNSSGINIVGVVGPKKNHPTYSTFKQFVQFKGVKYLEYDKLTDKDFIEEVRSLDADIAVVCSFNYKIPKVLLDSVKGGFINVHPSLLPKYRGPNPYSAVIVNGEKETGVTLHFMDETFDTGDIIAQTRVPITNFETMGTLFNRTNIIALDMLIRTLTEFETKDLPRFKQPSGNFVIAPTFKQEELLIDYGKTAQQIDCLIRALNPFVIARTFFRNTLVKVISAEVADIKTCGSYSEGEIVEIKDNHFYVATKNGLLVPTSMQFGSFFIGTSKEFIQILNPQIGERFQ